MTEAEQRQVHILVLTAVHHALEACKAATGQRRTIDHFVNKTHIANEVMAAMKDARTELLAGK